MKKTIGEIIDELTVTNIKIFHLIDKVMNNRHTLEDAKKIQDLNLLRSVLRNSINGYFNEREDIKV